MTDSSIRAIYFLKSSAETCEEGDSCNLYGAFGNYLKREYNLNPALVDSYSFYCEVKKVFLDFIASSYHDDYLSRFLDIIDDTKCVDAMLSIMVNAKVKGYNYNGDYASKHTYDESLALV